MTTSFVRSTTTSGVPAAHTDLRRVLATVAAALATAGGLIHLSVIGDHSDERIVAAGFAAMGISQCGIALWLLVRPSVRVFLLGGAVHALITATWVLSRTVGLWFIPGEAEAAEIGVADLLANTFSLAVIGVVVVVSVLDRAINPIAVPVAVARSMIGVALAGALLFGAVAVSVPHVHHRHGPVLEIPVTGHTHDPLPPLRARH